jgi:Na+/H+ antiporter NhaD/arsenite permease-like protein
MNLPALPATQVLGHDVVDWRLLLLLIGLFVVNHAFESTGLAAEAVARLAGNLLMVGSIANLIVVDLARKSGIAIDWRQHAVTGIPVTIGTLALAWAWLRWAACRRSNGQRPATTKPGPSSWRWSPNAWRPTPSCRQ